MIKPIAYVYEFKITLAGIRPAIWRMIQAPEKYTFWDLHVAIQDAMGWDDCHLHAFRMKSPETGVTETVGIPDEETWKEGSQTIPGWECLMADWFTSKNARAVYQYDFGDSWEHVVELTQIVPAEHDVKYPVCVDGKRACPPEDCGGIWGYEEFLKAIKRPKHPRHKELLGWIGGHFAPEQFDPKNVKFDNPEKRWKRAFS